MTTVGAFATVKWRTHDDAHETVLFVVGDDEGALMDADKYIEEHCEWSDIHDITVIEIDRTDWDIAKRGQNIGKDWQITNTETIEPINKED